MDLSPFLHNVSRIADALEAIARNTTPARYIGTPTLLSDRAAAEILEAIQSPAETGAPSVKEIGVAPDEPKPMVKMVDEVTPAIDRVLKALREAYDAGTTTANGLSVEMHRQGIPHPRSLQWNNRSVMPFMETLGLTSTYSSQGGRGRGKPKAPDVVEAPAPDPDPAPKPKTRVVEKPDKPVEEEGAHMSMRSLLTQPTRSRLEAWEKARSEGRGITEAELIAAAVAEGRVTKLPTAIDSTGYDHLNQRQT